ncbi:hypothetical protein ACLOJK_015504 [Asimina triloba]
MDQRQFYLRGSLLNPIFSGNDRRRCSVYGLDAVVGASHGSAFGRPRCSRPEPVPGSGALKSGNGRKISPEN